MERIIGNKKEQSRLSCPEESSSKKRLKAREENIQQNASNVWCKYEAETEREQLEKNSIHECRHAFQVMQSLPVILLSLFVFSFFRQNVATLVGHHIMDKKTIQYKHSPSVGIPCEAREETWIGRFSHAYKQSRWQRLLADGVLLDILGWRRTNGLVILRPRDLDRLVSLDFAKQVYFVSNDSLHDFKVLGKVNRRIDQDFGRRGHWTSNSITPV